MELVDNAFILLVPGAIAAGLSDGLFWWSLLLSLVCMSYTATNLTRPGCLRRPRGGRRNVGTSRRSGLVASTAADYRRNHGGRCIG